MTDSDLPGDATPRDAGSNPPLPAPPRSPVHTDATPPAAARVGEPEPLRSTPPSGRPFGRYVLLEELGHGGMGLVWKAWDTELSRVVALKQILAGELAQASQVERFMREARLAAKLRHPNVVAVHDVGACEGQHYFTSDFIPGRTLDAAIQEGAVSPRQAVTWVKQVAEALAYAHGEGVIHRDVKPSNVLIDGEGRPYVMDFGLAREVESGSALTVSGDLVGTPSYMSPEQAAGRTEDLGPATDQFSLGVTLYQLLTGRLPFDAPVLRGLLNAIVEGEATPPSRVNPRVHRDVEVVCLKAMEKDPARRYPTLRELAEDLGRWLEGEPIAARPASGLSRLARKAMKHWAVTAPTAAALLLAIGFGAFAVGTHLRHVRDLADKNEALRAALSREQAARADERRAREALEKSYAVSAVLGKWARLEKPVAEMETVFYDAALSIEEKRSRNAEAWAKVQEFLEAPPQDDASWVTKRALAGWARRLAGYPEEAEAWMREASERDSDIPYGAFLRAMVLFSNNVDEQPLPPVVMGGGKALRLGRMPPETDAMRDRRAAVARLLDLARTARVWGKEGAEAYHGALDAMSAMQREDYKEAEKKLTEAIEGRELEPMRVSLLLARGKVRYLMGNFDSAVEDMTAVLARRPGQVEAWDKRGLILVGRADLAELQGGDPRGGYRDAISEFGEALRRNPDDVNAYGNRGIALLHLGNAEAERGSDPRDCYERAIRDLGELLKRGRDLAAAHCNLGMAYVSLGAAEEARGQDPRASFAKAIAEYGEAVRREPEDATTYSNRGHAYQKLGDADGARGADPVESYRKAIADCGEALKRNPDLTGAFDNRGVSYQCLGDAERARGHDPLGSYERAIADCGEAIRRAPDWAMAYSDRGTAYASQGDAEAAHGNDPRGSYAKAIADFGEALKRNPELVNAYINRGATYARLGEAERARGADPRGALKEAIADFSQALKRNPELATAYNNRGFAYSNLAQAEGAAGADPRGSYEKAIADLGEALKRNPNHWNTHASLGLVWEAMGEPGKAVEEYEAALRIHPGEPHLEQFLARAKASLENGAHPPPGK